MRIENISSNIPFNTATTLKTADSTEKSATVDTRDSFNITKHPAPEPITIPIVNQSPEKESKPFPLENIHVGVRTAEGEEDLIHISVPLADGIRFEVESCCEGETDTSFDIPIEKDLYVNICTGGKIRPPGDLEIKIPLEGGLSFGIGRNTFALNPSHKMERFHISSPSMENSLIIEKKDGEIRLDTGREDGAYSIRGEADSSIKIDGNAFGGKYEIANTPRGLEIKGDRYGQNFVVKNEDGNFYIDGDRWNQDFNIIKKDNQYYIKGNSQNQIYQITSGESNFSIRKMDTGETIKIHKEQDKIYIMGDRYGHNFVIKKEGGSWRINGDDPSTDFSIEGGNISTGVYKPNPHEGFIIKGS